MTQFCDITLGYVSCVIYKNVLFRFIF